MIYELKIDGHKVEVVYSITSSSLSQGDARFDEPLLGYPVLRRVKMGNHDVTKKFSRDELQRMEEYIADRIL